ncbi:hypothetical protein K0M31_006439 [Melipona bicolor]|uniref:Uncharacterized protein n=1 Tax=Melipona bicolor TaxID=60889 RepID=A0AA40FU95_9HYME|nr:hypothetical protein K0M31_006439 [Melipona bicolor]
MAPRSRVTTWTDCTSRGCRYSSNTANKRRDTACSRVMSLRRARRSWRRPRGGTWCTFTAPPPRTRTPRRRKRNRRD